MRCPVDNEPLVMADRSGVEIDYCPKCRGVWLDRGELDKIIERASVAMAPSAPPPPPPQATGHAAPRHPAPPPHYRHDDDDDYRYGYKKKKKSLLGEIFDF